MQKSPSLTGVSLAEGTTNLKQVSGNKWPKKDKEPEKDTASLKQVSKNKKPKKGKEPEKSKIIAVAPNLYLKTTPKGKKRWLLTAYNNKKKHARVIGDAAVMHQVEAKAIAAESARHLRLGKSEHMLLPSMRVFSAAGATLIKAYSRHWKPITHATSVRMFSDHLVPWFGDMPIEDITRQDVLNWFDSMHLKLGAANRSLPLLSTVMQQAELYGFRPEGSNPCVKIKRYRLKVRECFLMPQQIQKLGQVLSAHEKRHRHQVALIRLLLLTGCRKGELLNLQWSFYRDGHLHLPDSKTGAKIIYLSTPARQILGSLPRRRSRWVFPGQVHGKPSLEIWLWYKVREQAGLDRVRLHDLRHGFASTAIKHGVNLRTVGALLGHQDSDTTLQYVHLCDDAVLASAQLIGDAIYSGEVQNA